MTREEIIEMAKKADLTQHENPHFGTYTATTVSLMRFAKLVAKRTWVGLVDEDELDWDGGDLKSLVKAIEAKLKEKNT